MLRTLGHMRDGERDTCTRGGIKSGMSLCLEKMGDEEMGGDIWNEVNWGAVESAGNKDGRG